MIDWKPVETAPKDGRWFLTYTDDGKGSDEFYPNFDFARWDTEDECWCKWGCGFDFVTHWADVNIPDHHGQ